MYAATLWVGILPDEIPNWMHLEAFQKAVEARRNKAKEFEVASGESLTFISLYAGGSWGDGEEYWGLGIQVITAGVHGTQVAETHKLLSSYQDIVGDVQRRLKAMGVTEPENVIKALIVPEYVPAPDPSAN